MSREPVEMTVSVIRETAQAFLVSDGTPDEAVWVPKSQCELTPTGKPGLHTLTIPEWLAQEKGLI